MRFLIDGKVVETDSIKIGAKTYKIKSLAGKRKKSAFWGYVKTEQKQFLKDWKDNLT